MVTAPTADELYSSARKFAQSALEAHHNGDHQRAAIDAGTSLEHLTKACLASRSPALLVELKPGNWESLALLCGHPQPRLNHLRTVGLREACGRVKTFVSSSASKDDLDLLINLRDGVVHAAVDEEVEERVLVAFVQQSDAILEDMRKHHWDFWGQWSPIVTKLVVNASDEIKHRVGKKLAAAKSAFMDKYGGMPSEMRDMIGRVKPRIFTDWESAVTDCPACDAKGVAKGRYWLDETDDDDTGEPWVWGTVKFTPDTFSCQLCELRLANPAELAEAGVPANWDVPEIDPAEFFPGYQQQGIYGAYG